VKRIAQPPLNPARRDPERHDFWPGFIMALIAVVLIYCGAQHLTGVETVGGAAATEIQLVRAFSSGGLQYATRVAGAEAPRPGVDAATAAAELERWAREQAGKAAPGWTIRVDTGAKTPCPT
jgi:hypothetical protein